MADDGSVRIELDDSGSDHQRSSVPDAPNPESSKSRNLAIAVLVVALIGAVFLALRPNEGETAAGTDRGTTIPAPRVASTTQPDGTQAQGQATGEPLSFLGSEVVRGESGFLALLASENLDNLPSLYRSDDGREWGQVVADLTSIEPDDARINGYSHLVTSGDGYAVLRTKTSASGELVTERLVSNSGQRWVLDGAFTPLQHGQDATPIFHVANAFGLAGNDPSDDFFTNRCEALIRAAGRAASEGPLLIHRWARDAPSELQAPPAVAFVQLDQAVLAAFVPNGIYVRSPSTCGGSISELAELPPPTIALISPDDTIRQIALPEELLRSDNLRAWPEPSLAATETGLLAIFERSVWNLDTEIEVWTKLADLPAEATTINDYRVVDDRYVVGLANDVTIRADLRLGEVVTDVLPRGDGVLGTTILYADDEVVITANFGAAGGTNRIDLPS